MKQFIVLFFAVLFISPACGDSGDSADPGDKFTDDVTGDDAENPDAVCLDCDMNMLDKAGDQSEDVDVTSEADVEDLLAEYLWIEGRWKCLEIDGVPDGEIIDVEITMWDDELGAEVDAFPPYGPPSSHLYFKKNTETGQFEAIYPEPMQVVGYGDPTNLTVELYASTLSKHTLWEKIE